MFDGIEPVKEPSHVTSPAPAPVGDTPTQEAPRDAVDPGQETQADPVAGDRHPLEPGGERFNQVWARAKKAEELAQERDRELQREREQRIRLEERNAAHEKQQTTRPTTPEREYTWQELQHLVDEGKATIAQIADYREKKLMARADKLKEEAVGEAMKQVEQFITTATKQVGVRSELAKYTALVPDVLKAGSESATRVNQEYNSLLQRGFPPTPETELVACELAFGKTSQLERNRALSTTTNTRETFQDIPNGGGSSLPGDKKLVSKLDGRQRTHYERLIRSGVYGGWDDVEAELQWQKPR